MSLHWARYSWLVLVIGPPLFAQVVISPSHPELLQQGIMQAYAAGNSSVVVPAGVYVIPVLSSRQHLSLSAMNNFEIDARGATFVFQDVTSTGIVFNSCNGVYFHGATMYFATPPFSQGVIQAIASDLSSIDVVLDAGYPANLDNTTYFSASLVAHLFDPTTRLWKRNVFGDVYGTRTQRLSANSFRIFTSTTGGASVGDLIGIRAGTGDHAMRVTNSSNMVIADLTILNSPNFAIAETLGGDKGRNQYNHITVERNSPPPGATTTPLFSTTADGIHSTEARTGPLIQNCDLENMPDDGIAVHGHYSWVLAASGNILTVSNTGVASTVNFKVGDPLRLVDANDAVVGDAVVTAITPLPNYTNTRKSARTTVIDFTAGPCYQITLDRPLTAGFDSLAANPNASGAGFSLMNNKIVYNRGRGMNLKGDNGTVQGNNITGSTMEGIHVGPEYYWSESGFSRNLTIANNTIADVAYWGGRTAAILISPYEGAPTSNGFQNLTITGNTLNNFNIMPLFISSASGVNVANNVFQNVLNSTPFQPNLLGQSVPAGTLVFVTSSNGVQFAGNSFQQLGALYQGFVAASASTIAGVSYLSTLAGSSADFAGTQGAANWFYGYFPAGNVNSFTQLPVFSATAQQWQHVTFGPPWTLLGANSVAHPNGANNGAEEWAVRRWVSPNTQYARISGHLAKNDTHPAGTGVYGRIYINHSLVYEHFLAATDGVGTDYVLSTQLNAGDIVDFALAPNGVDSYDSTTFSSSISAISGTLPYITAVANSASGQAGAGVGSYVSIYGVNFAPAGFTGDWSNAIVDGKLPTALDGLGVSFGGAPAYLVAITPNQINVVTSNGSTPGLSTVVVNTAGGVSAPANTALATLQPAFFQWPENQAVATHLDYSIAAQDGTFGTTSTVPARPGETIVLWGTGFGPSTPPAPDGVVTPASAYTVNGVSVTVGQQNTPVIGAALAPGLASVYQIALQVPSGLSNGTYPVVATVSGASSPAGVMLAVHK